MTGNVMAGKQLGEKPILRRMPGPWGKAIERLRIGKGWTRAEAAAHTKISATTFGRIESGRHTLTTKLQKIADTFNVSIDEVLMLPSGERQSSEIDSLIERRARQIAAEEFARIRSEILRTKASGPEPSERPHFTQKQGAAYDELNERDTKKPKKKRGSRKHTPPTRRSGTNG